MFKVFSLLMAMLMLSACNDIDGKITVYDDFMLVDEDGRHIMIAKGTHAAEFSYRIYKHEIELEIEGIDNGKDRDFEFQIPDLSDEDFHQERLELHFPTNGGGRELDTNMVITNTIMSAGELQGRFYRCRDRGSAVYGHRPVVFRFVNRITHVAAQISSGEDTLALFEASKSYPHSREVLWVGECGDPMPENLEDVVVEQDDSN